jgi:hypothetical protein
LDRLHDKRRRRVLLIYDDDQHRSEDNEVNGTHSFSSMLMMLSTWQTNTIKTYKEALLHTN